MSEDRTAELLRDIKALLLAWQYQSEPYTANSVRNEDVIERIDQALSTPAAASDARNAAIDVGNLAEGIHVAFRKASDHEAAHRAWLAIRDLPMHHWSAVVRFIADWIQSSAPAGERNDIQSSCGGMSERDLHGRDHADTGSDKIIHPQETANDMVELAEPTTSQGTTLSSLLAMIERYTQSIQGKNELVVGLLNCNFAMLEAAELLRLMHQAAIPSPVSGDLEEKIARVIDPGSWQVMDAELERTKRKYKGQNVGWPSDQFKHKESLATARSILSLLPVAQEWKPIEEIPESYKDGRRLLGFDADDAKSVREIVWSATGDRSGSSYPDWTTVSGYWYGATHWMPLPPAPTPPKGGR